MKRECGGCTACCKAMHVADLTPPKPMHTWCPHCAIGSGCKIYGLRPGSCREFQCAWLQDDRKLLPEAARPDRIKVVLQATHVGGLLAHCDPSNPTAWRNPLIFPWLKSCAANGYPVSAEAGKRYWVITASTEWEVPSDCITIASNGLHLIRVEDEVSKQIGLYIRPECRTLGPDLNVLKLMPRPRRRGLAT